jgi:ArsR family transcriptional regulator
MSEQAEAFKALADDTRLRILNLLMRAGCELCCCELTDSLEEPQYNVSKHLKVLRQAGRWVYYSLPGKPDAFRAALLDTIRSLPDAGRLKQDSRNLDRCMGMRQDDKCAMVPHCQSGGGKSAARE